MTVKALKRQLMAAIAMIMVSLIALSSSTYAWFTMNKTVTASGLTVKAQTEGGIKIKRLYATGNDANGSDSVTFTIADDQIPALLPTSTKDCENWVHAAALTDTLHNADTKTYIFVNEDKNYKALPPTSGALGYGTVGGLTGKYYYVFDKFVIMKDNNSQSFTDLYVSECTVTRSIGTSAVLSRSLRVAVTCGQNIYIFEPVPEATKEYDVVTGITKTDDTVETTTQKVIALQSSNSANQPMTLSATKLVEGVVDTVAGKEVTVYVYFEGEDGSHTTENISKGLENLTLNIKFSCTSVQ